MKISQDLEKAIISGLLPLLVPAKEVQRVEVKKMGASVIEAGVTRDKLGKPINPHLIYSFFHDQETNVNHRRRIREVIKKAKDEAGLEDDLARYVVKFGKSKETISQSIINNSKPLKNES